ncbi:MAG: acyltransferase [Bacilli bacterium]|nr:acyltransferase [Bacilli bacterium]
MEEKAVLKQVGRNFGIDILRMIAMVMVIVLHVIGKGTLVLHGFDQVPTSAYAYLVLQIICGSGVNIYALVSGYVGYGRKARFANLVYLWLRVLYYAVIITVIFYIAQLREFTWIGLIKSFFPTIFNFWWYWTAYFALCLFAPLLNLGLERINKRTGIAIVIAFTFVFSVLPVLFVRTHIFGLETGLSVIWLMSLYVIGAIIKKFELFSKVKTWILVLIYIASVGVIFGTQILFDAHGFTIMGADVNGSYFHNYVSPFTLISAIALILIFSRIDVKNKPLQKVIGFVGPSVFSAYLITEHYFMVSEIIRDKYTFVSNYNQFLGALILLAISIGIFVGCIIIDIPRELLFKYTKIKKHLNSLEDRLLSPKEENN